MSKDIHKIEIPKIKNFQQFSNSVDYSFMDSLNKDPQATEDGNDHKPREVFSGHYVPVTPTVIDSPIFIAYSKSLFEELGLSQELLHDDNFRKLFSGDISIVKKPMRSYGWATGYALSINGTEYTYQCPFKTGNGYGDGRAISIFEGVFKGKRWEMQLKGGGPTPYCRGGDGRAVLRSSVREFLAQEFMHALGVPSSRSLTLYSSMNDTVLRPWYRKNSSSYDPDILIENPVAISTRVAPSFLRIGQLELFARRARTQSNDESLKELELLVKHLIFRDYKDEIHSLLPFTDQILLLASSYQERFTSLVANWLRVGYCQGNFNSDNCSTAGITLDYGPFGFCELFDPDFQPWTGGGEHFSFFNQPRAAESNFDMFCSSLLPLLKNPESIEKLDEIKSNFKYLMNKKIENIWSEKIGLEKYDRQLVNELLNLMSLSKLDFTIFFRSLCEIPNEISVLKKSFYQPTSHEIESRWNLWLKNWNNSINYDNKYQISKKMKLVNPKYTWREWLVRPVYEAAEKGDFSGIIELQNLFKDPYGDNIGSHKKFDSLRPNEYFNIGGISHYSCSS
tara:strand:- start:371 stop:2065 length:1695 start_codon:yes stop_codon:yes gene_type:complete